MEPVQPNSASHTKAPITHVLEEVHAGEQVVHEHPGALHQAKLLTESQHNIRALAQPILLDGCGSSSVWLAMQQASVVGGQNPDLVAVPCGLATDELFQRMWTEVFHHPFIN